MLDLKDPSQTLPSLPLKVRSTPVQVGEKVYLVGCPYVDAGCKQHAYEARVTQRAFGDRFQYTLSPPVDLSGFSGAPIVDENGYLVGVMTVWFDRVLEDGKDTLGGGEDAAILTTVFE